jgi:hypothetical protein
MSGFLSSGLYPMDVQRAINALRPREKKRKRFEALTPPMKRQVVADDLWGTPQGSTDLQKQMEDAIYRGNVAIRDFKCIMKKAMKTIDQKNSQIQRLEEEKAILKASAAAKEPTGRVPVQFDPNLAFPEVEQIITARDRAEMNTLHRLEQKKKNTAPKEPKKKPNKDTVFFSQFADSQKD